MRPSKHHRAQKNVPLYHLPLKRVHKMFFLGHNFVYVVRCTLKQKKTLKSYKFFFNNLGFFQPCM